MYIIEYKTFELTPFFYAYYEIDSISLYIF